MDPNGIITSWTEQAERIEGYKAEEIIGQHFSILHTPEDRDRNKAAEVLEKAVKDGFCETQGWRVRKNGSRFWALVTVSPLYSADGRLRGFVRATRDASERKRLRDSLKLSEQKFETFVENHPDAALLTLDPYGLITSWNIGAELIHGYTKQEVLEQRMNFSAFYTKEDRDAGVPSNNLRIALETGLFQDEGWRVRKDRRPFLAKVTIRPLFVDGKHVGFGKVTHDITARKAAEEALRKTQDELAKARRLESVGRFVAGVAHDFGNKLSQILGPLEILRLEENERKKRALIDTGLNAAEGAASLVQQLLRFARSRPLHPASVDVKELISRRSSARAAHDHRLEHIAIDLRLDKDTRNIFVDPAELENALDNLIENAIKAMPNGGTLTLATSNFDQQRVRVSVGDTGVGMSKEVAERAFEPFFTSEERAGTGLGLAQVHGFATQSGGQVRLHSIEGKGTEVTMLLPASTVPAKAAEAVMGRMLWGNGETILVVDDMPGIRETISAYLSTIGYRPLEASSADSAIDILRESADVGLLLSDIRMPGMSGVDLVRQAKKVRPGLPAVLISGFSKESMMAEGGMVEDVPFLQKPFRLEELSRTIRDALADS
jgi:PAS domain S-box-containing protein